jgi:hypothetical protein
VDQGVRECLPFLKVLRKASRSTDKCVPFFPVDEQVPALFPGSFLVDEHKLALFQGVTKSFRVDQAVRECLSGAKKLPRQSTLAQPNQIQRTTVFVPCSVTHYNQLGLNIERGWNSTDILYQSGPSGGRREILGDGEIGLHIGHNSLSATPLSPSPLDGSPDQL